MSKQLNLDKRKKFLSFLKKGSFFIIAIVTIPKTFAAYIFKDENSDNILELDSNSIKSNKEFLGTSFVSTADSSISYNGNGEISSVTVGSRTWTYNWSNGQLQSITDGIITKTFSYSSGDLTGVTVTGEY